MRINNNISSLVTQGALFRTERATSKSLEKLSTGLRINRAADDAAGLGVSENLRTQVRGLKMAMRNTQDAIALLKVADGALQEQANILQRMRELVIQAKNDTYTATERGYMYEEFSNLMNELDRIAQVANYNGLQLFATPMAAGLDIGADGDATGVYVRDHAGGIDANGYTTNHATARSTSIWSDTDNSIFGSDDFTSAHHFNMMVGANYSAEDAAAFDAGQQAYGDRGASNLITIQLGQMDANALLTPSPTGWNLNDLGLDLEMGQARELWDSFAWNPDPALVDGSAPFDWEDTYLDFYGPTDTNGVPDMGLQGKLNLLVTMIDGNVGEINDELMTNGYQNRGATTGLDRVNRMRSSIGALINRLEHSVNNTLNSISNQQYAESLIRDADFAAQATALARNQILTQSSTAMLAQSNMIPSTVLQLIG